LIAIFLSFVMISGVLVVDGPGITVEGFVDQEPHEPSCSTDLTAMASVSGQQRGLPLRSLRSKTSVKPPSQLSRRIESLSRAAWFNETPFSASPAKQDIYRRNGVCRI
jgi:hypothetical protein